MAAFVMLSAVLLGLLLPFSMADNNNILYGGGTPLNTGESLTEGDYAFTMTEDCDLVLSHNGQPIWPPTDTGVQANNCSAQLQTNGNFVIYGFDDNGNKIFIWATGTGGVEGHYILVLERDGHVVIYDRATNIWIFPPPKPEPTNRNIKKIAMMTNN